MNEYPGVSESIADTARESWGCYESDHYRSAVTTARTVIEQVGKDQGHTEEGIDKKIKAMVDAGQLPGRIKEAVFALKKAGNTMVHGDLDASMSAPEAETWLTVMDQMLEEIYVAPKRIHDLTEAVSVLGRKPTPDADDSGGESQDTYPPCDW